jgi:hypothetical protein
MRAFLIADFLASPGANLPFMGHHRIVPGREPRAQRSGVVRPVSRADHRIQIHIRPSGKLRAATFPLDWRNHRRSAISLWDDRFVLKGSDPHLVPARARKAPKNRAFPNPGLSLELALGFYEHQWRCDMTGIYELALPFFKALGFLMLAGATVRGFFAFGAWRIAFRNRLLELELGEREVG